MDAFQSSSSVPVKAAAASLAPRPPVNRPRPINRKKKSSLSSLERQRFYLPGKSAPSDELLKSRSRNNLLTWQEFVMDGFGPTMSLASLVSWQDMLCYSPPTQGLDGPGTPPEIRDALVAKKQKNTRGRFIKSIQLITPNKNRKSPRRQIEGDPSRQSSPPRRNTGKPWMVSFGKASTFGAEQSQGPGNSKRRFSIQSKPLSDWASRAKKFLHLKRPSLKKGKGSVMSSPTRDREYRSSSSGSVSPNPNRRLLARENAPTKITVKRPSLRSDPISPVSSASVSTASIAQPVSGWTFLAPPGQSSSLGSSAPTPAVSLQTPVQFIMGGAIPPGQSIPPINPLLRHHSVTANRSKVGDPGAGDNLLEPRMSVADSTKSHETLWRRSVSSPSISSSYTSLSMPSGGSRQSSIWDYRGSIVSIPRGSVVSVSDAKRTLRANLTGNLTHDSRSREGAIRKRVSDTPTHTHVHSMFCPSGHLAPFHMESSIPDIPKLETEPTPEPEPEQQSPLSRRATIGGRRPSIVKRDHLEIYSHPYFEVAPNERHRSLSSVTFGSRPEHVQRHSTMDSMGSFRTALDGTEDSTADVSFSSF
ncbi:hypothetical protein TWF703_007971 [Orbilia oligospora]|uniref:Uncharacterized protein n=1 Tax=Orbilia oligospora TaxID=2813651 RepID=A0A7C8P4F9_ORBOL|nr:hypothetical protein TWF703_007971 [Orbilia oligospora]